MRRGAVAGVALALVLVGGSAERASGGTALPRNGAIVFERGPTIAPNGQLTWRLKSLVNGRVHSFSPWLDRSAYGPVISPDGSKIAFARYRKPGSQLTDVYVVRRDGTGLKRLTVARGQFLPVSWSPDGRWILYRRVYPPNAFSLPDATWVIHPDGSGRRQLRIGTTRFLGEDWSADGHSLVGLGPGTIHDLWVLDLDTQTARRITTESRDKWDAAFIPGGGFSYVSMPDARDQMMAVDDTGGGVHEIARVRNPSGYLASEQWSADGQHVAIQFNNENRLSTNRIAILHRDAVNVRLGPHFGFSGRDPIWSPNGKKLLFERGRFREGELWVVNADGTNMRRLTRTAIGEIPLAWLAAR